MLSDLLAEVALFKLPPSSPFLRLEAGDRSGKSAAVYWLLPESVTICGDPAALSVIVSVATAEALEGGINATKNVQELPAFREK